MHGSAAEFLVEERETWRPYEALGGLADADLDRPVEGARGWSGRDLIAHLVGWHTVTLDVVRELAAGRTDVLDRYFAFDEAAIDAHNAATLAEWRALPIAEVRRRFETVPEELRTALAQLPEGRWIQDERAYQWMFWNAMDHYAGHAADLAAILAGSASPATARP